MKQKKKKRMDHHRELFILREAYVSDGGVGHWERRSLLPNGIRNIQEYTITKERPFFFSLCKPHACKIQVSLL